MSGCTTKKCNCSGPAATYQDNRYGKNMRVFNVSEKGDSATCTVCGKETSMRLEEVREVQITAPVV